MKVKDTQSCPALCNPMDYTVIGILRARILGWVAFSFEESSPKDPWPDGPAKIFRARPG